MATINKSSLVKCRYCLTNTDEHIVEYFISDEQDKFEKMLEDTFNIQMCYSENKNLCLECEEDFRNAAEVKKRVLEVQKIILEQSEKLTLLGSGTPKKEVNSDDEDCYFEDSGGDDGTADGETRDAGMGDVGKEDRKADGGNGDDNCIIGEVFVKIERMKNEIPLPPKGKTTTKRISDKKNVISKVKEKQNSINNSEKGKHRTAVPPTSIIQKRRNTIILINNSNMCLFVSKKTKYACYFCNELFLDMQKLRTHSLTHKTDKILQAIRQSRGLSLKNVDISNLVCKKCSHPCTDLEELRVHLKKKHGEAIEGAEHLLLPFKIEHGFVCVICQKEFTTFLALAIHMNRHSNCNVCEICGVSFNNRLGLRNHIQSIHREKQCKICLAVLRTMSAKTKHLRRVHNIGGEKRYCTQCDMTFRYDYKLREHMIEKHGVKKTTNICKHCNKEFASASGVKKHYKSVHLGEKKHACSLCAMSFFTSSDKRRHERRHGNEKPFSCDLCEVKFASKGSMQRHLKKKHGGSK